MRGSDIDKYSRVIFPIMFLSFHLVTIIPIYLELSIHKIIYLPPFSYLNHLNFFLQTLPYSMINIDDRIWHWHLIFSDVLDDLHEHLRGHSSRLGVAGVKTTMQYRIYSEFHWWYILIYRIYSAASTTSLSQRPFPRQCEFLPDSESVFTWRRNWNRSSICPST